MSRDIQLRHRCPHLTIEERVQLASDRRSLFVRQPVANQGSVRILINNSFFVPSTGLYSRAVVTGSMSGPFNITANETELRVITSTKTVVVNLPVGIRVPTDTIVSLVNAEAKRNLPPGDLGGVLAENINGHLRFSDLKSFGRASSVFIKGRAADLVGFDGQAGARGQQVYPGWRLEKRPDTLTNLYPRFMGVVKGNPIIKVTYVAVSDRCLRCDGGLVENDYRFNPQGDVRLIDNENLLLQASLKILLTRKGSNPFHTWYGTEILDRIGLKATSTVAALIDEDVRRALSNFQKLQQAQGRAQEVTAKERLFAIAGIRVEPHERDPTTYLVDVVVRNASREPISLTIIFTTPGVQALADPNTVPPSLRGDLQNLLIPPTT